MPRLAFEGLELCDGKLSRTILRGLGASDGPRLPGLYFDDTVPREWYRLSGMPIRLFFVPYGNIIEPSIKVPIWNKNKTTIYNINVIIIEHKV